MRAPDRPLRDYGAIGDGRTAALVARGGSLDWWCPGRFDTPSAFGALLDAERGGAWAVGVPGARAELAYAPSTNVLEHRFRAPGGAARLWDLMAWPPPDEAPQGLLVRAFEALEGEVALEVDFAPRPDYGRVVPEVVAIDGARHGYAARNVAGTLVMGSTLALEPGVGRARGRAVLRAGERAAFALRVAPLDEPVAAPDAARAWGWLRATLDAWRAWDARTRYEGPHAAAVRRSALALRLLTHDPTGGIVAAPTTSLPEAVGGVRNWDYRFVWVRDAWLLAQALDQVGHPRQAEALLRWLVAACARHAPDLRVLYGLTAGSALEEHELPHLRGWRGSRPVRVGNAAKHQFQLDVYGYVLGALDACRLLGSGVEHESWPFLRGLVDIAARRWREPDAGIWEFRTPPRHFVHSKVMAWVALDRGARAARDCGWGEEDAARWALEAAALREEVLARGWSARRGAFVQAYGSDELDAATLLVPLVGFLPPHDPRVASNLDAVLAELGEGPFVRRYACDDGLPGREGAFVYCCFWLVDNLVLQGRLAEARRRLDALVAASGPLGLLAEMVEPATRELLGNYPQGFSHIGLIRSALLLAEAERVAADAAAPR